MLIPCSSIRRSMRPASFSGLAMGGREPAMVARLVSSISSVMRVSGCCPRPAMAVSKEAANQLANKSLLGTQV